MENNLKSRFVWSNWMPVLTGMIFLLIFYVSYFVFWNTKPLEITSYAVWNFAEKYGVFIPFAYSILSIIILYLLYLVKWIIRLNFWIVNLILLLIVFWFNLFLWIQLLYFEPRFTDVAIFIIDSYAKHMMYASIGTIFFIFLSVFIKTKA